MFARNGEELLKICTEKNWSLADYAINYEVENSNFSREGVISNMHKILEAMRDGANEGQEKKIYSVSGLIGGDAYKIRKYLEKGNTLCGDTIVSAIARAISSSEVNAAMGRIVACPTAGSCGILPAVILTVGDRFNFSDDELVTGLFASSAVGLIIAQNATLSGAEGGCQAECGSAAAMASAATVEMMGGDVNMALNASAIVIKNILGLVCDPVAGLVEVPCAKRNFAGAVSALSTADLVMAGVYSKIPFDDTIEAMYRVGKSLPASLRETAQGGLATTKTGQELNKKIFGDN
ncbi:L-serine ammonia-lyase, iron-sulfur-dependent, subunit alpha [uncultured Clostridium sp.]|jgi:L-serine dehydratase|uniref:L-serine ammonia-lyase, iron-sulfur-dependent, subunit alpha n=1 Tax=uncultured Clostridium sp. TaxID=59620 RepID=UPI00261D0CB5|nr:L-serine ammonia-lyase, iron-sulfur-dependent, subunit alpha [uncultured Clostridium sp.]